MHETAVRHFIDSQKSLGTLGFGGALSHAHANQICDTVKPHFDKLAASLAGGSASGGRVTGGSLVGGDVKNPKEAYHHVLTMKPHQFELQREIASQLLGAHPSPMWGKLVDRNDGLEAKPEDYENLIRMPNTHAAARLIEAEHGTGGGFWKSVKHTAKKAFNVYNWGHKGVKWVGKNQAAILALTPPQYRSQAAQIINTANQIDDTINPLINAAAAATGVIPKNTQQKQALYSAAKQSIRNSVQKHMPDALSLFDNAASSNNGQDENDYNPGSNVIQRPPDTHQANSSLSAQQPVMSQPPPD